VCLTFTTLTPQVPAVYDKLRSQCRAESSHRAGHGIRAADPRQVSSVDQFQHPCQPAQYDVHLAKSAADVQAARAET